MKALEITPVQIPKNKLQDHIYSRLCTLILDGEIEPGQRITIQNLSQAFDVSTMPVREALQKLTAKQALTVISGRSIGVPQLTPERLFELTRVRLVIEVAVSGWAAERASKPLIQRMEGILTTLRNFVDRNDRKGYLRANREFHFALYEHSGSVTACSIIEDMWLQIAPYFHHLHGAGNFVEGNVQHVLILQALKGADIVGVQEGVREDIVRASQVLRTMFD